MIKRNTENREYVLQQKFYLEMWLLVMIILVLITGMSNLI